MSDAPPVQKTLEQRVEDIERMVSEIRFAVRVFVAIGRFLVAVAGLGTVLWGVFHGKST